MRVTARLPVEDLAQLFGVDLPEDDDVETVGGLLAREIGRVPIEGSAAEVGGLRLVAETTGGRRNRIDTLLVCRVPEPSEDGGEGPLEPPSLGAPRPDQPAGVVEG
jgi:CBS domain containing-hemolysin-like protein